MTIRKRDSFNSPLVVGYKGEIGSFILQGLLRIMPKALDIWCFDINETEKEKINRIKKSSVIFLCVPIEDTLKWLNKYKAFLKGKTVIEKCSLKGFLSKQQKEANQGKAGFELLFMHILFRPSATPNKSDRRVILIDRDRWKYGKNIIEKITEARIIWVKSIYLHDSMMAYNQALLHRVILVLGSMTRGIVGETYITQKIKELDHRIHQGLWRNPSLYKFIQKNEHLPKALKEFKKTLFNFDIKKRINEGTG